MSSDSSDSDSDEINYDEQIAEVKNKLSENPFDYNARLELVKLYRAANKLEELREERDELATRFPLQECAFIFIITDLKACCLSVQRWQV